MLIKQFLLSATCSLLLASSVSASGLASRDLVHTKPKKSSIWGRTKKCPGGLLHLGRGHFICLKA